MTVREYRTGESQGVADLWRRNPTPGGPLTGLNPDAVGAVLRKTERPGLRFLVRMARLFRRPIFVFLIVDLDGRVMGTTLLSFTPEAAYISGVVVDSTVRRQGHAQAMMRASDELCRKYHRRYAVLDVVVGNDSAIRLYERWGYQTFRDVAWLSHAFGPTAPPLPPLTGTTKIRPFRPRDGSALAAMDNALMSPEVRAIDPRHASDFRTPAVAGRVLSSEVEAWVAEVDARPAGFLRTSVSGLMEAANLSSPLYRGDAPESVMQDLTVTALRWLEGRKVPRVLTQVAEHQRRALPVLEALGFKEELRLHTMVRRFGE
jgi:ribosomal protein S18 acetylase RimI-like enzyme